MMEALTQKTATELAALIARGEVSSLEAVEAHIARVERVNAALNAVVWKRYEPARAEAREADARRARGEPLGPLHGVPITVKECLDVEGTPSTFGLPSRAGMRAERDDVYVARLRRAGAIVVGKTNVSQLLLYLESDNPLHGRTNNPWDLDRTPGGSSGGQAAIIAARASPLGLATDLGGSVRLPAAFCGVAGFKPTSGRCPDAGRFSAPIGQRAIVSQVGAQARAVADLSLCLKILNDGENPETELPMPLGDPASVDVSKLRIAYYTDDETLPPSPAVRRAVLEAVEVLRAAGAEVVPWTPPDVRRVVALFFGIVYADGCSGILETLGRDKRDPRIAALTLLAQRSRPTILAAQSVLGWLGQPALAELVSYYGHRDALHYWKLVEEQLDYQRRVRASLDRDTGGPVDAIVCPPSSLPAVHHGKTQDLPSVGAYCLLYNVLGYPAGVVPFTEVRAGEEVGRAPSRERANRAALQAEHGSAGLPIGVQVVSRPYRDHVALAVMAAIERAAGAGRRVPRIPGD